MFRNIPWITDGANLFLEEKINNREIKTVLEFGSGASTLFFASKELNVISIEHDKEWYDKIQDELKNRNLSINNYLLLERPYNNICETLKDEKFDLVFIDGRDRVLCAESSFLLVKKGGYLILDNDERSEYKKIHEILFSWDKNSYEQIGADLTGWTAPHRWITTVWKK